jgi:hypothetical protein
MADFKYTDLPLVAKHIPDYSLEVGPDGNKRQEELPGHIHIGTIIEGVFKPLAAFKAAGLFADIERAKQSQGDQPAADQPVVQQSGTGVDVPQTGDAQQQG